MLFTNFTMPKRPLRVVVKNRRWDAYVQEPATPADHALLTILQSMGGINESVADGEYDFHVKLTPHGQMELSLIAVPTQE